MASGLPGIFYVIELAERNSWHGFTNIGLAAAALSFIGSSNFFVLGLILLLAGFKSFSVLTSPRLKRGLWMKLAGANLLAILSALVMLDDQNAFGNEWKDSWLTILVLAVFLVSAHKGILLLRTGWKYDVVSAEDLLKNDIRPPVVYIRSFKDDDVIIAAKGRAGKWYANVFTWTAAVSIEQELALIMNRVGPVVAIGKPGEPLPELGASRLYFSDDEWQDKITEMMKQCRLVVIRGGTTANLWWEIEQAGKLLPLRQLLIVSLGRATEIKEFDLGIEQRFGKPVNPRGVNSTGSPISWLLPFGRELGRIAYFDEGGRLYVQPIRWTMSVKGFVLAPYRPNQDSLEAAFRKVFQQLDLPWTAQKSQSTATVLALFGGMLGLHHFYLGRTRKGVLSVLFCWTGVPLILGLIDGVKFALAEEEAFKRGILQAGGA